MMTVKAFNNLSEVNKWCVLCNQKFSESYLEKIWDSLSEVNKGHVLCNQKFSETFLEKIWDSLSEVNKGHVLCNQKFSESYLEKIWDSLSENNKGHVLCNQKFSETFLEKLKNKYGKPIEIYQQPKDESHDANIKRLHEIKAYAEKYGLEFDGVYLTAYRKHDNRGCGSYKQTIFYEVGGYYTDWHCDLRVDEGNSFGLGAWPHKEGNNILVKIHYTDWGCAVDRDDGKIRCWGFTVVKEVK